MDFRKAFDSVPHEVILLKLAKSGADAATCRLVRTFLKDHTAILGMDIEEIKILCGVLQGGILSPLFFDLFIDDLPNKELGEEHGMLLGLLIIAFLLYADDTILISGSAEGLQCLLTPLTIGHLKMEWISTRENAQSWSWEEIALLPAKDQTFTWTQRNQKPKSLT